MALDALSGLTAGFGLVGAGISLYSGLQEAKIAGQEAGVQKQILGQDIYINKQRQQQAANEARRGQLQDIRSSQMASSMALSAATNQGAQRGSGLQGGLAQIAGQTNTNAVSRSQNLDVANNIFGAYNTIDQYKMQLADLGADMAKYKGIGDIGSALSSSASPASKILTSLPGLFA